MAAIKIPLGSDHKVKFALSIDSEPLDLTEVEEIEVKFYQRISNILASYKLSDNEVEITSAANGRCECILSRNSITKVPIGSLFVQISVDMPNEDFDSGFERLVLTETKIGDLVATA
jgi:hypothetical protein